VSWQSHINRKRTALDVLTIDFDRELVLSRVEGSAGYGIAAVTFVVHCATSFLAGQKRGHIIPTTREGQSMPI
jgi:hypothetical protein